VPAVCESGPASSPGVRQNVPKSRTMSPPIIPRPSCSRLVTLIPPVEIPRVTGAHVPVPVAIARRALYPSGRSNVQFAMCANLSSGYPGCVRPGGPDQQRLHPDGSAGGSSGKRVTLSRSVCGIEPLQSGQV
jgi:hypothetical protein